MITKFLNHVFTHWKTSSIGFGMVIPNSVHLGFMIADKSLTETALSFAILNILGGVALLWAQDPGASSSEVFVAQFDKAVTAPTLDRVLSPPTPQDPTGKPGI